MITAIVPVKNIREAKRRLSGMLSLDERYALAYAMLLDVLNALRRTKCLKQILVVTPDAEVEKLAKQMECEIIEDPLNKGETAAVNLAIRLLQRQDEKTVLVLPADVPAILPQDIEQIVKSVDKVPEAHFNLQFSKKGRVVIVPSRDGTGTNAILCSPPDVMPLRFGPNSFAEHVSRAGERGVNLSVLQLPRVALDLDTPQDLRYFLEEKALQNTHTYTYYELKRILGREREDKSCTRAHVYTCTRKTNEPNDHRPRRLPYLDLGPKA